MNIIVPLAGKDKNFEEKGLCKPLIEINEKTAIQWIAESRPFCYGEAIFLVLKEHKEKYKLDEKLREFFGNKIKIIIIEEITEGAPQTVLLVKDLINNDDELIIDLPDQYIDFKDLMEFLKENRKNDRYDGIISTFKSLYWNRGYMIIENGFVKKVSEKDKIPISEDSTACVSYFKHGKDFVWAAEQMIQKNKRAANGAFLISLAYNELIEAGKKVGVYPIEFISTLGTIEGVNAFDQHVRKVRY